MHEFSIAVNLVELAVDHALNEKAKKIRQIEIDLGELSGVVRDSLEFCFETACKGTIAEGSILFVNLIHSVAECVECKKRFETDSLFPVCPNCDSIKNRIVQGKELRLKSITVD